MNVEKPWFGGLVALIPLTASCTMWPAEDDCQPGQVVMQTGEGWVCQDQAEFGVVQAECEGEFEVLIFRDHRWQCVEEPVDFFTAFQRYRDFTPPEKRGFRAALDVVINSEDYVRLAEVVIERLELALGALLSVEFMPAALFAAKWGGAREYYNDIPSCREFFKNNASSVVSYLKAHPEETRAFRQVHGDDSFEQLSVENLRHTMDAACLLACALPEDCLDTHGFTRNYRDTSL